MRRFTAILVDHEGFSKSIDWATPPPREIRVPGRQSEPKAFGTALVTPLTVLPINCRTFSFSREVTSMVYVYEEIV